MIRIEEIVEKVGGNYPQADLDLLRRAYFFRARAQRADARFGRTLPRTSSGSRQHPRRDAAR